MNIILLLQLLRVKHWVKNVFVIVPVFFSGSLATQNIIEVIISFIAFSLLASAIYILNDWCDIETDKQHAKKKSRPLASGAVSTNAALFLFITLLTTLAVICVYSNLSLMSVAFLVVYFILNTAYSFGLKHVPILELFIVGSGFIIRLLFGASVFGVILSSWIIVCTGLLSLMLVVGKRRGDLAQKNDVTMRRRSLIGYNLAFLDQLNTFLATATFTSYVVFCTTPFATDRFGEAVLITSGFVLFGICTYMKLILFDNNGDDPTTMILADKSLNFTMFGWLITFVILIYY